MADKKTFKNSPAMQFISPENKTVNEASIKEQRLQTNPEMPAQEVEYKNRRVQLLLRPSLYRKIVDIAAVEKRSVNDAINCLLENAITSGE